MAALRRAVSSSSLLFSPLSSAAPASNLVLARSLFVKATASPSMALQKLEAKMMREGSEKLLNERRRYLKAKYQRQKNKKEAVYMETKRLRVHLVEQFLKDPHIQPF